MMHICDSFFPSHLTNNLQHSNSLDLNPLYFSVLDVLEQKVSVRRHQSLKSLKKLLTKAWGELDVNYLRPIVESLTKHLKVCVKQEGGDHFE